MLNSANVEDIFNKDDKHVDLKYISDVSDISHWEPNGKSDASIDIKFRYAFKVIKFQIVPGSNLKTYYLKIKDIEGNVFRLDVNN